MRKNLNMRAIGKKTAAAIAALALAIQQALAAGAPRGQTPAAEPEEKTAAHTMAVIDGKLDANSGPDFAAQIMATTQDADLDAWRKMPKNAVPQISTANKVVFGEKFSLFALVRNASVKDGKFSLKYTITAAAPDGKILTIVEGAEFEGAKKSPRDMIVCPDVIDIKFDRKYQPGTYTFTVSATDQNARKTVSNSAKVEVAQWREPKPIDGDEELDRAFRTFSLKPSPELLYAMYFSDKLDLEQKNAPYNLNFIILGFFKAAFLRFDFLLDELMLKFDSLPPKDRAKVILISRFTGKRPIKNSHLGAAEIKYQDALYRAEIPNPYENWHRVLAPSQMDMLWGEFYASGAYRPIRRIMNLLANEKESQYAQSLLKARLRPKDDAQWNRFTMGMLHILAVKSILRNAGESDLADQYCVWAYENRDIPEESMKVMAPYFDEANAERSQFKKAFKDVNFPLK